MCPKSEAYLRFHYIFHGVKHSYLPHFSMAEYTCIFENPISSRSLTTCASCIFTLIQLISCTDFTFTCLRFLIFYINTGSLLHYTSVKSTMNEGKNKFVFHFLPAVSFSSLTMGGESIATCE